MTSENLSKTDKIINYLKENPNYLFEKYVNTANYFGTTLATIDHIIRKVKSSISEDELERLKLLYKDSGNKDIEDAKKSLNDEIDSFKNKTIVTDKNIYIEEVCKRSITLEQFIKNHNIDLNKYNIDKHVINTWGSEKNPFCQIKVWLSPCIEKSIKADFVKFLETYSSPYEPYEYELIEQASGCLLINKQDSHLNKLDINGNNDIQKRFNFIEQSIVNVCTKSSIIDKLDKIIYVIGSDEFNSEWNSATTKGTPQTNTHGFHESFNLIADHEVKIINILLSFCNNLEIVYLSGNHDEYIGYMLITWLQAYYRLQNNLKIDISPAYRKYCTYSNTAIMLNHGDAIKPSDLVKLFPIEYKSEWSKHDNFYIFTGDKHREAYNDFNGIRFYGLPALSDTVSSWDSKNGYVGNKAELTAFFIKNDVGITSIFKEPYIKK